MKILSERLRKLRKERGLTQKQIAEAVGVSQSTIFKYELWISRPKTIFINNLANFFGVSVDYLIGRIDEVQPQ